MANPSIQTLADRAARAQQLLTEAQDRLSATRDKAVRAHDRLSALRRERILRRGEQGAPADQDITDAVSQSDTAMSELQAVESDLGVKDAGPAGQ